LTQVTLLAENPAMRRLAMLVMLFAWPASAATPAEHELRSGGAVELVAGARGAASLTLVPSAGRRIDPDAPLSLRLAVTPAEGLKLPRPRLGLADAADPRAEAPRFELPLEAVAAGSYLLTVETRFWLCRQKTCRPVRDTTTIAVTVATTTSPR
jgi:hypothetical protein